MQHRHDTIVALSTPPGVSAIAVIRLSGAQAIAIAQKCWLGKPLDTLPANTARFGKIVDTSDTIIDEVVLTLFRAPHSFTREDVVEISTHGSSYIIEQVLKTCLTHGARLATAGEFTQRAYLNGQFDLAQAEAIADLIAADSAASHRLAMTQMRGGYSQKIKDLREDFIRLAALLELELDFSEEDVEFADRSTLRHQLYALTAAVSELAQSFALGNVLKNGIPVAIIGKPNAGKSTLLNALLREDRAIVSDIAGTTRDAIEAEKVLAGVRFRFIDTAGLREATDTIERIGIERTHQKIREAALLLYLFDLQITDNQSLDAEITELKSYGLPYFLVGNKADQYAPTQAIAQLPEFIAISARTGEALVQLEQRLVAHFQLQSIAPNQVLVSNVRHHQQLQATLAALAQVEHTMNLGLSTELIAADIKQAVYHLSEITGQIANEDLLDFIFSKFCIGK